MPKEQKPNWSSFTKAELIKTIKRLDARQTKLLNANTTLYNRVVTLEAANAEFKPVSVFGKFARLLGTDKSNDDAGLAAPAFPWEKT